MCIEADEKQAKIQISGCQFIHNSMPNMIPYATIWGGACLFMWIFLIVFMSFGCLFACALLLLLLLSLPCLACSHSFCCHGYYCVNSVLFNIAAFLLLSCCQKRCSRFNCLDYAIIMHVCVLTVLGAGLFIFNMDTRANMVKVKNTVFRDNSGCRGPL